MKFTTAEQISDFLDIVNECEGDVSLHSYSGDIFNLKSQLSQYVAIGELLSEHGDELELFCRDRNDEAKFVNFFKEHPEL